MKAAVVTPYYKEPLDVLQRCHDSILTQTHADMVHVLVADGHPRAEIDRWDKVLHLKLPPHGDFGDTPRAIGALSAATQGADAILLLDADNWFEPNHVETLYDLHLRTGAQVVTATRTVYRMDGTRLGVCTESDGAGFNDTNCYFLTRPAFWVCSAWGYKKPEDAIIGDRVFWDSVKRMGFTRAHCAEPTVNYVTAFAHHYQAFGERPPPGAKVICRLPGDQHRSVIPFEQYEALTAGQTPVRPAAR